MTLDFYSFMLGAGYVTLSDIFFIAANYFLHKKRTGGSFRELYEDNRIDEDNKTDGDDDYVQR